MTSHWNRVVVRFARNAMDSRQPQVLGKIRLDPTRFHPQMDLTLDVNHSELYVLAMYI